MANVRRAARFSKTAFLTVPAAAVWMMNLGT